MVKAGLVGAVILCSSCATARNSTAPPSNVQAPRSSCAEVIYASASSTAVPVSIGHCDGVAAGLGRRARAFQRRELFIDGVILRVGSIHGARSPITLWQPLDASRTLLRLCARRAGIAEHGEHFGVLLSIAADGRMRYVRSEREDELGRCITKVLAGVEFAPTPRASGSSEVLLTVGFRPSPWTLWVSN